MDCLQSDKILTVSGDGCFVFCQLHLCSFLFCTTYIPMMLKRFFFVYTQFEDQTAMFLSFVSKRHLDFSEKKDRHVRVIGQDAFDSLQYFYTAVKSVFEKGLTGGCRIIATKPALN